MDHQEAIRLTATERYLMDELPPELRDQFEEHFFDCPECALDVRAASQFIEKSKDILAEEVQTAVVATPMSVRAPSGWLAWLRPAMLVPVLALLLLVIAYQNFVTYPEMRLAANHPEVLPWATINTRTRGGSATKIDIRRGSGFVLMVNIPPDAQFSSYVAELYDPAGNKEWSLKILTTPEEDTYIVRIPPANRDSGTYALTLHGVTSTGQNSEISRTPFELQVEK
jgi:putative zinc finger protein